MRQQKINNSLNREFPGDVRFLHKTGNRSEVTGDGGYFELGQDCVVILTALQDFTSAQVCRPRCTRTTGFQTMSIIGKETLAITREF